MGDIRRIPGGIENPEQSNLAENFLSSIKETVKPGMRLG